MTNDVLDTKLSELNSRTVGEWLGEAKQVIEKGPIPGGFKLREVTVTVSVSPSVSFKFDNRRLQARGKKPKR